jgi:hypothetical protein
LLDVAGSPDVLAEAVDGTYDALSPGDMGWLKASTSEPSARNVLAAVETVTANRMDRAKKVLENLLEAGEIRELDKEIKTLVKNGDVDAAFLTVLNQNVQAAADADDAASDGPSTFSILSHVSTCVQEELEKNTPPEVALLHKLCRTSDSGLRGRILCHYLTPQREILLPDTTSIPLDVPKEARIAPMKFSEAVMNLVSTLRSLDIDGDTVVESIDEVRQVAKEARLVIQDDALYDDALLEEFTLSLVPAFGGSKS